MSTLTRKSVNRRCGCPKKNSMKHFVQALTFLTSRNLKNLVIVLFQRHMLFFFLLRSKRCRSNEMETLVLV